MSTSSQPLLFTPLSSSLSPAFWHSLTNLKLHVLKLSDAPVPVRASIEGARFVKDRKTGELVGLDAGVELGEGSLRFALLCLL